MLQAILWPYTHSIIRYKVFGITWYIDREFLELAEFLENSKKAYSYAVFRHFKGLVLTQYFGCLCFA